MLLLALLYGTDGYRAPLSNRESGDGRADVLLEPVAAHVHDLPAIAIEVKRPKGELTDEELGRSAREEALAQAERLGNGHGLAGNGLVRWGISFSGKRVACACARA